MRIAVSKVILLLKHKMRVLPQEKPVGKFNLALTRVCKSISPIYHLCRWAPVVYWILRYNLLIFSYSGIQPINLTTKDGIVTAQPVKKDLYYFLFYFITYSSMSVYGLVRVRNDTSNFNVVPKVFVEAECYIVIILKLVTVLLAFVLRKRASEGLNILSHIDVGFEKAGVTIDYRITFRLKSWPFMRINKSFYRSML